MNRENPGLLPLLATLLTAAGCAPDKAASVEPQAWEAAALATAGRSDADTDRDADRKPAEVLAFAGATPGMMVMAASGWYTEVLAVAAGPDGTVYAENPRWLLEAMNGAPDKALTKRLQDNRLPNVQRKDAGLDEGTVPPDSVDVALTALNFHDTVDRFGDEAGVAQLNQIYAALKPGGALILIDHSGIAGLDNKKLHRIEEFVVAGLVAQTQFQIEGEGGMLRHPEDDMPQMVFGKDIRGKTDRFVLKLRKPG